MHALSKHRLPGSAFPDKEHGYIGGRNFCNHVFKGAHGRANSAHKAGIIRGLPPPELHSVSFGPTSLALDCSLKGSSCAIVLPDNLVLSAM